MKRPIESDYQSAVAYTRSLEAYCDYIEKMVAAERDACAKVCETHAPTTTPTWVSYAAAIRARK